MITLLIFLAVLSVLVLAHEAGHYVAARLSGVKAEEFGFGFPPRAFGFVRENGKWKRVPSGTTKTYANTIWSINWLPLGGFVRMKGEEGGTEVDKDSFAAKGWFARLFILSAGVIMNWVVASLIFGIGFMVGVPADLDGVPPGARIKDAHIEVVQVVNDSAAAVAGLELGDTVVSIAKQPVMDLTETLSQLKEVSAPGTPFTMEIKRDDVIREVTLTPKFVPSLNRLGVGIGLSRVGIAQFPWYQAIPQGVLTTVQDTKLILQAFGGLVKQLVWQRQVPSDVSGPVGIAVMTGKVADQGFWPLMHFAALLSINLAVVNFLPIPALDGGRVLFLLIESIRRKRIHPNWEANIHRVGFIVLISLIVLVTIHDIRAYGSVIWHGLKNMVGL